jgi:hypothetical protein
MPDAVLEIVTRHLPSRRIALERMVKSLRGLGPTGVLHTVMVDHEQRGLAWANEWLRTVEPQAQWIWLVDDDDVVCEHFEFVGWLASLPADIDLVMVLVDHGRTIGVLPPRNRWRTLPPVREIGGGSLVLRADLYRRARDAWTGEYEGDYAFITRAWEEASGRITFPQVMQRVQRISKGDPRDVE